MTCQYCNKTIGMFRVLVDHDYCCNAHRALNSRASSRAARDIDVTPSEWELFRLQRPKRQSGWEVFAVLAVGICAISTMVLNKGEQYSFRANNSFWGAVDSLKEQLRTAGGRYKWDSQEGSLSEWKSAGRSRAGNWKRTAGAIRPGSLRIWESSQGMTDYRFEFGGRISTKGLSWVYRATSSDNHYAAKILLKGPASAMRGDLLRYAVVEGKRSDREIVVLPVPVRRDETYRIRTDVRGRTFSTFINGKLIDHWEDDRLARGGIGFFSEKGEIAEILWVEMSAPRNPLDRMLANMGLLTPSLLR